MRPRSALRLGALLAVHLLLAIGFARATPPLEASDEARHLGYVLELVERGRLPVADPERPGLAAQEAVQPPLYYLAGAALIRGLDTRDARAFYHPVPGSPIGRADLPGPRNMFAPPATPTGGETLRAVGVLRAFSIALGAATVLLTYATARTLTGAPAALFAAALVALNPMFLFIGASVNNDDLVTAVSALLVWAGCRPGFAAARPRAAALAGASIGVAMLAKASGLVLLPAALYRVAVDARERRRATRAALLVVASLLAVAGWWLVRNVRLYGEPLAFTVQATLAGNLRPEWQPLALLREWEGFVKSFWGVFGAFNVIYPEWVYRGFFAVTALGVASVAVLLARPGIGRDVRVRALALLAAANLLAVAFWTSRLLGSQGRLMFPSLPAICVLAALGVQAWPRAPRRVAHVLVPAFLAGTAAWACLLLIPDSYLPR